MPERGKLLQLEKENIDDLLKLYSPTLHKFLTSK